MTRQLNNATIALIKIFEGCRLEAYPDRPATDPKCVWTIGYGHTHGVKEGDVCDPAQADTWLIEDAAEAADAVTELTSVNDDFGRPKPPLPDNQFGALVSFVFNLGPAALKGSHLLAYVNMGNYLLAAAEFLKWDHEEGKVIGGLLKRRTAERALFLT